MPIRFACPACQTVLKAPARKAGSFGRCPACTAKFRVPQAAQMGAADRAELSPSVQQPQVVFVQSTPAQTRSESHQSLDHATHNKPNLWMWFVGLPTGILLLTIALLLVVPFLCCGGTCFLGVLTNPPTDKR